MIKDGWGLCDIYYENSLLFQLHSMSNHQLPLAIYTVKHSAVKFVSRALVSPPPESLTHTIAHTSKYLTIFKWKSS